MKRCAALARYCELVAAAPVSLTALSTSEAIRAQLVDDALTARAVLGDRLPRAVVDVGSGNGSPGIPLAIAYGAPITLLESVGRKAGALRDIVAGLRLDCPVIHARSEEVAGGAGRDAFDVALARALAPPPVAAELCLPLVRPGGRLLLWTGSIDRSQLERAASEVAGIVAAVHPTGKARNLVELRKLGATPERFPRRPGMAQKRPLPSLRSSP